MELLTIKDPKQIYQELASFLIQYKDSPQGTHLFVVEGTLNNPIVALRYPGRKLVKRTHKAKTKPKNFIEWANLCDFEVVGFRNRVEIPKNELTYSKIFEDFAANKIKSATFCRLLDNLYKHNTITGEIPTLHGIDSKLFLLMLKWLWIQEDLNYKLSWREVNSKIPYRLQNRNGGPTSKGAGRDKFYAALILVHGNYFDAASMRKIIP